MMMAATTTAATTKRFVPLTWRIWTLGYAHCRAQHIIESLPPDTYIIDVRLSPHTTTYHFWDRSRLETWPVIADRYKWIKAFGNKNRFNSRDLSSGELLNPGLGIRMVLPILNAHPILLLCECLRYEDCHRLQVVKTLELFAQSFVENIRPALEVTHF